MAKADAHEPTIIKRVSGKGHDDGHGGAWKVAFADFCLALLCLFLVLWLLNAREKEEIEKAMQAVMGNPMDEGSQGRIPDLNGSPNGSLISREPVPGQGGPATSQGQEVARQQLDSPEQLQALAQKLSEMAEDAGLAGHLETTVTAEGLRVMLHDTDGEGMFARGSAVLNKRFSVLLNQMGPIFARIRNQLLILGHTDATPYFNVDVGGFSNWNLSNQRAMAARLTLLNGGMHADSVLQVIGMADKAPLDAEHPRAAPNRRIELVVLTTAQARRLASAFGMPAPTGSSSDSATLARARTQVNQSVAPAQEP
ncbi:OmpA family protein [Ideonella sp. B7]|uniref:flagellar motor protein MotB n=1 Tax=Ideonella benzenivorans TaxID=2831643 RepID=UPI001CED8D60|nr:flagellar motor protein MotB [Ideonella benzenivorans]MCA6217218.1 OmpA family protein [Ideonella benzenivorans]